MSQLLSAVVLVLPEDSSPPPPPPQPARGATSATASARRRRLTAAPVYSSATLRRVLSGAIVAAALLAASFAQTGGASPVAHASAFSACDISGQQQNLGASYVTSLKVQGVGCTKGKKVIKAYHRCRHQSGGPAGTCSSTLFGFKYHDVKRTGLPNVQYKAPAKCHKV